MRIWDLSFGQRYPVKGVFTKMEVRKFVQRLHGSYQNKVDKRPRYFSLFMAYQKEIIITKLTDRVSVFFSTLAILGAIYLFTLSARVAIRSCRWKFNSQFFLFLCLCFSFVFLFPFLMLAFQFRWKVLLLFFYFRIRYRYIFLAS